MSCHWVVTIFDWCGTVKYHYFCIFQFTIYCCIWLLIFSFNAVSSLWCYNNTQFSSLPIGGVWAPNYRTMCVFFALFFFFFKWVWIFFFLQPHRYHDVSSMIFLQCHATIAIEGKISRLDLMVKFPWFASCLDLFLKQCRKIHVNTKSHVAYVAL